MSVAKPKIHFGLPIPDANFSWPHSSGLSEGWSAGNKMAGHVYGIHLRQPDGGGLNAYKYGTGRSQHFDLQADMDGGSESYILSAPTPAGMVMKVGASVAFSFAAIFTQSLGAGQTVVWKLQQYDVNDVIGTSSTLYSFGDSDDPASAWDWALLASFANVTLDADVDHFRLACYVNANSSATGDFFVDFVGVGFHGLTGGILDEFDQYYTAPGFRASPGIRVHDLTSPASGIDRVLALGTPRQRMRLSMAFSAVPQTMRDMLSFYWYGSRGTPTGNSDTVQTTTSGYLGGFAWPLLLTPNRSGIKEAMYCRMEGDEFPIVPMTSLGWLPDPLLWEGRLDFREVFP